MLTFWDITLQLTILIVDNFDENDPNVTTSIKEIACRIDTFMQNFPVELSSEEKKVFLFNAQVINNLYDQYNQSIVQSCFWSLINLLIYIATCGLRKLTLEVIDTSFLQNNSLQLPEEEVSKEEITKEENPKEEGPAVIVVVPSPPTPKSIESKKYDKYRKILTKEFKKLSLKESESLKKLKTKFISKLEAGTPSEEDLSQLIEEMQMISDKDVVCFFKNWSVKPVPLINFDVLTLVEHAIKLNKINLANTIFANFIKESSCFQYFNGKIKYPTQEYLIRILGALDTIQNTLDITFDFLKSTPSGLQLKLVEIALEQDKNTLASKIFGIILPNVGKKGNSLFRNQQFNIIEKLILAGEWNDLNKQELLSILIKELLQLVNKNELLGFVFFQNALEIYNSLSIDDINELHKQKQDALNDFFQLILTYDIDFSDLSTPLSYTLTKRIIKGEISSKDKIKHVINLSKKISARSPD